MALSSRQVTQALSIIILVCFLGLAFTSFLLYQNMQKVRELTSQKEVLMDQLADEVLARQRIKKQLDTLIREKRLLTATALDSSDTLETITPADL